MVAYIIQANSFCVDPTFFIMHRESQYSEKYEFDLQDFLPDTTMISSFQVDMKRLLLFQPFFLRVLLTEIIPTGVYVRIIKLCDRALW